MQHQTIVTGGEDGKINVWPILPVTATAQDDEAMDVDVGSPKLRKRESPPDADSVSHYLS